MAVNITQEDIRLIKQPSVECFINIEVLNDDNTVMDSLDGIIAGGSETIDANSDIRRTCSFTIIPTRKQDIKVNEASYIWLNRTIIMKVGIKDIRTQEITWYLQGSYIYTATSGTYDANTNTLQVNCADFMALLDGSRNGNLGQLQTIIPAYEEDSDTGEVIQYNYIRDAIIYTVGQLGRISNIQVEDIGEYKGLEDKNPGDCVIVESSTEGAIEVTAENIDLISKMNSSVEIGDYVLATGYALYRINNPTWNCVPYDLEFSCGLNRGDQTYRGMYVSEWFDKNLDTKTASELFINLMQIPEFRELAAIRLSEAKDKLIECVNKTLDEALLYEDSYNRNYDKFKILGIKIHVEGPQIYKLKTWKEHVEYLREWVINRINWLNDNLNINN